MPKKQSLKNNVIDWQECLRLTSDDKEVAEKLLQMFIEYLDKFAAEVKQDLANNDLESLGRHIHKLHGATCYTGVPELKKLATETEQLFHKDKSLTMAKVSPSLKKLTLAITRVRESYGAKDYLL